MLQRPTRTAQIADSFRNSTRLGKPVLSRGHPAG